MDEQLKTTLRDKADEMRLSPEMPLSLRARSRRRRLVNAVVTGVVVLGIGVAAFAGATQLVGDRPGPRPAGDVSSGSGQPHIWPEGSDEDADSIQREVDEGQGIWRRDDPEEVARAFAVEELYWDAADVETTSIAEDPLTIAISNPSLAETAGAMSRIETTLFMERWQGRDDGILIVARAENDLLRITTPSAGDPAPADGKINYTGILSPVAKDLKLNLGLMAVGATSLSSSEPYEPSNDGTFPVTGKYVGKDIRSMFFFLETRGEAKLAVTALALAPPEETPTPGPTNSPTPDSKPKAVVVEGPTLYIDNLSGDPEITDSVNSLLQGPFAVTSSGGQPLDGPGKGETHLLFLPGAETEAAEIRDTWFPGAPMSEGTKRGVSLGGPTPEHLADGEISKEEMDEFHERLASGEIPPNPPDVTLILGPDYTSYPIVDGIEVHRMLIDFVVGRTNGQGAEIFLTPDALARYDNHEDRLELYSYWPEREEFRLNELQQREHSTYRATISVDPHNSPEPRVIIFETVTVESRPDGGFWITDAERDP